MSDRRPVYWCYDSFETCQSANQVDIERFPSQPRQCFVVVYESGLEQLREGLERILCPLVKTDFPIRIYRAVHDRSLSILVKV